MACWIPLIFILLYLITTLEGSLKCPSKCICKNNTPKGKTELLKVHCGIPALISHLDEINLKDIAYSILQLNLSGNHLSIFLLDVPFLSLQKLDISKNQLTVLYDNEFVKVPNLRRLDISNNRIKTIETLAFVQLYHLERLKLNQNEIEIVSNETLHPLIALKQLDISNNSLICNCDTLWILEWARKLPVKLLSNPKCHSPTAFKGTPLRKLEMGVNFHCKSYENTELSVLELEPNKNQVVFDGDTLELICKVHNDLNLNIKWLWLESNPKTHFKEVKINEIESENGLSFSKLEITRLNQNHTGLWKCQLDTSFGNYSSAIKITVISKETKYCPRNRTINNKGIYLWPKAIVNYTATVLCETSNQKATHFCSPSGKWLNLNTSQCMFISETTNILEEFSKVDFSLAPLESIYKSAKHFRNYTSNLNIFKDLQDLFYCVTTIEHYVQYLSGESDLSNVLIDTLSNLMGLSKVYLEEANKFYNVTYKILNLIEVAIKSTSKVQRKQNIAFNKFVITDNKEDMNSITCTWYGDPINLNRLFYCIPTNGPVLSELQNKIVEASVQIPASLFLKLNREKEKVLIVTMLRNSKLFSTDDFSPASAIVGLGLNDTKIIDIEEPVYVMIQTPAHAVYDESSLIPVWWNSSYWSSDGCELSHQIQENVVFRCQQLGYYGLFHNVTDVEVIKVGETFKLSHPAIYVGGLILFTTLLIVVVTYSVCYMSIQMPKKIKHSLLNTWIAVILLVFVYTFGIYQTEDIQLCQIIGLLLHYITLCVLFWICVGVTSIYKKLNKSVSVRIPNDELLSDKPIQRPILGLYLIGWGISLIVCGISGAVNMKEYRARTYCFLHSIPALSALFIPAAVLLLIICALFVLIRCSNYNTDINGHLSEGTQITENVDLDMLEPCFPSNPERASLQSSSTKTRSSEVEDSVHGPNTHIKAYAIFLITYLLTWLSCAGATVKPFGFKFEDDVFSILFAFFASILATFTFFFYCIARSDVRNQWLIFRNCLKNKGFRYRSRNVSDTTQSLQIQRQSFPLQPPPTEARVISRSSSHNSSYTKSNSNNSNALKAVANLNSNEPNEDQQDARINNVNLVVLHRQQYGITNIIENPTNSAQLFYNPYQSTVARRFFKRQRQYMMKHNNLGAKCNMPSDSTSAASSKQICLDQSLIGSKSKVNNTNIHVEHIHKVKPKNFNVFSETCESLTLNNVPIEKLMLNAEKLRKRELIKLRTRKKQNDAVKDNNMRTVSQQCSLEYSSDSTSIWEKSNGLQESTPENTQDTLNINRNKLSNIPSDLREPEVVFPKVRVNPLNDLLIPIKVQSRSVSRSTGRLDELHRQTNDPHSQDRNHSSMDNLNTFYKPESDSNVTNAAHINNIETNL